MAKAEIFSGICGFRTSVQASMNGSGCNVKIESDCKSIQRLGEELTHVDPFQEISFRRKTPLTLELGSRHCAHAACPVPVGIIKAVEVEAGLALPADVSIKIFRTAE